MTDRVRPRVAVLMCHYYACCIKRSCRQTQNKSLGNEKHFPAYTWLITSWESIDSDHACPVAAHLLWILHVSGEAGISPVEWCKPARQKTQWSQLPARWSCLTPCHHPKCHWCSPDTAKSHPCCLQQSERTGRCAERMIQVHWSCC